MTRRALFYGRIVLYVLHHYIYIYNIIFYVSEAVINSLRDYVPRGLPMMTTPAVIITWHRGRIFELGQSIRISTTSRSILPHETCEWITRCRDWFRRYYYTVIWFTVAYDISDTLRCGCHFSFKIVLPNTFGHKKCFHTQELSVFVLSIVWKYF